MFVVLNYCMALTKISSYLLKVGVIEANIRLYTVADFKILDDQYLEVYGFIRFIRLIKLMMLDLKHLYEKKKKPKMDCGVLF